MKGKYHEIAPLGILNCSLLVPYWLTKTWQNQVQIQQNNSQKYNKKCLLKIT